MRNSVLRPTGLIEEFLQTTKVLPPRKVVKVKSDGYSLAETGVYPVIEDFDALFDTVKNPFIVNRFVLNTAEDKLKLKSLLHTTYDPETLSLLPSCAPYCGVTKGGSKVGHVCPVCDTEVMAIKNRPLEPVLWIEAPEEVGHLIHPTFFIFFNKLLKKDDFNLFQWLIDPNYKGEPPREAIVRIFDAVPNFRRGIGFFAANFDVIFDVLLNSRAGICRKEDLKTLARLVKLERSRIFPKVIPLPNSVNFVNEKSEDTTFADPIALPLLDAVNTISSIKTSVNRMTVRSIEVKVVRALNLIVEFFQLYYKDPATSKKGIFRKHIFGSRLSFTARAVISSNHGIHKRDEVILPWGMMTSMLRLHIEAYLMRHYQMTSTDARAYLFRYMRRYDPLIDHILMHFINSGRNGRSGVRVCVQRNPSLALLSAQGFYVPDFKRDVDDVTISMSQTTLKSPNADKW